MKISLFILFISSVFHVAAQGVFKSSEGDVSFFSQSALEDIDADNKNVSSFINASTREVVFVVPIRNFRFENKLMQDHFNEKYLESDKYPDATFQGKINETVDFKNDGEYKVTATGDMMIHGVEKQVTDSGTLIIHSGKLSLKSEFMIALSDYNIKIPKIVVMNIAEVVRVLLNVSYLPYKKE